MRRLPARADLVGRLAPGRPLSPREVAAVDVVAVADELVGPSAVRRTEGVDPHLVFAPPRLAAFPSGPVELSWDLWRTSSTPVVPELYLDTGEGFSEATKVVLPSTTGGPFRVPVELPDGLRHLRIDLPSDAGVFVFHDLELRRLAADVNQPLWRGPQDAYAFWVAATDALHDAERDDVIATIAGLAARTTFSVVMPVHDPPVEFLRAAVDSVRAQLWPDWQLCIADDASRDPEVVAYLEEIGKDPQIEVVRRATNGNISAASNDALAVATGEWLVLLDHDDVLHERALYAVAAALQSHPEAVIVHSDEDKLSPSGQRFDPYFKPDPNIELLWGQNVISHLGAYRRDVVMQVGGFRSAFDGSQDYDLALRVIEHAGMDAVVHVPEVLYHWRVLEGSLAMGDDEKSWAHDAATRALVEHLDRTGVVADVTQVPGTRYRRVVPGLPAPVPTVTIVIPTRDRPDLLGPCLQTLQSQTTYASYDVLIVDNGSVTAEGLAHLSEVGALPGVRVMRDDGVFNWSRLNNAAAAVADGSLLCFLNDDIEIVDGDWLTEMVRWASRPGVGAVGARLDYPDGRLQHAGVVMGLGGEAAHAYQFEPGETAGQLGRAKLVQQCSAVTGACMLTSRELFLAQGGFDEVELAVAYSDLDYCLRLRAAGRSIVWSPFARLIHHESASRGPEEGAREERRQREAAVLRSRWPEVIDNDPFFNPNLSRQHTDFRPCQIGYVS